MINLNRLFRSEEPSSGYERIEKDFNVTTVVRVSL